jgi:hypothetical protein
MALISLIHTRVSRGQSHHSSSSTPGETGSERVIPVSGPTTLGTRQDKLFVLVFYAPSILKRLHILRRRLIYTLKS